ncbi:MAG: hypothetical protein AMXMBFR53_39690 [Gemmatimonadota bacterium]
MPSGSTGRGAGGIIPFTLSEILALLFFIIVLALVFQNVGATQSRSGDKIVELLGVEETEKLGWLLASEPSIPKDFTKLVRGALGLSANRPAMEGLIPPDANESRPPLTLGELVDTTAKLLGGMATAFPHLREEVERARGWVRPGAGAATPQATVSEAAEALGEANEAFLQLGRLLGEARGDGPGLPLPMVPQATVDAVTDLQRSNADLGGQLRNMTQRGLDHPPCWTDAAGSIEFALLVVLRSETVDIAPAWPARRQRDVPAVDGLAELSSVGTLDYTDFRTAAAPVLAWAQRQDPECRHFVLVADSVTAGKEAFKDGLFTVEDFFYKRILN